MNFLSWPKRAVTYVRHHRTTAAAPQHNDVYLVEFPKSGVTWLSTILANMALSASGRREVASFASVQLYVPDIHVTTDVGKTAYDIPPVRLIKSHAEFNPNYVSVIYLVRKPLDVMKSYFRFNEESSGPRFSSFDDFCRSEAMGIPAWKRHVRSWLTGAVIPQRLHVCRYEDLLDDPANEVELINQNFGWGIDAAAIAVAVSRSAVGEMKKAEQLYRSRNPRYTMTFVRGGGSLHVEEKTIAYIEKECAEELRLLGYT